MKPSAHRSARRFFALGVLCLGIAAAAYGTLQLTFCPRPVNNIHVRWAPGVDDFGRQVAERRYSLSQGEQLEGRTWAYTLSDLSRTNISSLVRDPVIEDTQDIDRIAFRVSPTASRGPYPGRHTWIPLSLQGVAVGAFGAALLFAWFLPLGGHQMTGGQKQRLGLLLGIVALVHLLGWTMQIKSGEVPWEPAAPIDSFSAGFLWMTCVVCVLIAFRRIDDVLRLGFWSLGGLGFMALAIDEVMEFHEQTSFAVGDDDYIKILAWVLTAAALWAIGKLEPGHRLAQRVLWLGYVFHCLYTLVEMGDGEFFTLPMPRVTLLWTEEILEMLALSCYFVGMTLMLERIGIGTPSNVEA